jgi:hypothetical protein
MQPDANADARTHVCSRLCCHRLGELVAVQRELWWAGVYIPKPQHHDR